MRASIAVLASGLRRKHLHVMLMLLLLLQQLLLLNKLLLELHLSALLFGNLMCKIPPPATKSGTLNTGRCTCRVLEDRATASEAVVVRGHHAG